MKSKKGLVPVMILGFFVLKVVDLGFLPCSLGLILLTSLGVCEALGSPQLSPDTWQVLGRQALQFF